ncbi:MAG: hypothetical protein V3V97_10375 [Hyphomicrobiaceae bacterium]
MALALAGCSGGATTAVQTSAAVDSATEQSMITGTTVAPEGQSPVPLAVAPAPVDPIERAVQVGWTVARAQKCGFHFYPQKVRTNYLTYVANQGASPESLQKAERAYDFSRATVAKTIAKQPDYCSDKVLREVRTDLPKLVSGDFNVPVRKKKKEPVPANAGFFSAFATDIPADTKPMDRTKIFTPPGEMTQ